MRFSKSILLTAAALAMPLFSQASPLKGTTTLNVDNLTFTNFSCVVTHEGAGTPNHCGNGAIKVQTITQPGVGIEITSGFTAFGKDAFRDAQVSYNVSSTTGISQIGLEFNGTFAGQAIAAVNEMVFSNGKEVGYATVQCGSGDAGCTRTDEIQLTGTFTNLFVQKDIILASFSHGSLAWASYVDQTFNDTTATPEPSSMALLGGGLLGAAGLLRRRKAAVKA